MDVGVVGPPVGQPVDQPRVAMVSEDHRSVGGEQRVETGVGDPVWVLAVRLEAHQIDDVDDAHLQVREVAPQDVDRGQGLQGRDVAGAGHDHVGHAVGCCVLGAAGGSVVVAGPVPDTDAPGAVGDRRVHRQVVQRRLLARHDDVDVVPAAQAVVGDGQQRVRVRREVHPDYLRLLVDHMVDEARVLMGEAVVVLPPDMAGEQVVQRRDRTPPRDVAGRLQPLRVLVHHRVDDVDERLVAGEEPVPAGEEIPLQPALAQMLREHLHDPAVRRQVVVAVDDLRVPGPGRRLEQRAETVGDGLVRAHDPERRRVRRHHVPQETAEDPCRLTERRGRVGDLHGVVTEVGQGEVTQQLAAVGMRVRAHPPVARRREAGELGDQAAVGVEELLGPVAVQPPLQLRQVLGVVVDLRDRHLMGSPRALDLCAVDDARAGPALRGTKDDHGPRRAGRVAVRSRLPLNPGDLGDDGVHDGGEALMDPLGIVPGNVERLVAVAAHQLVELGLRDAREHGRLSDLVAVQVEDRQHRAVTDRIEELVRVPARRQRAGLGLPVPDDRADQQVRIVERGAEGMGEGVAEFPALVDRAGDLRRHVAGDAAGEGELAEQPAQPGGVPGDGGIDLGVRALQVGVRDDAGATVTRADDVDRVQVVRPDHAVHVRVDQVESRCGAPVAEQTGLDVLGPQGLPQQGVVEQVDLTDRQVVRRAPVGVDAPQLVR